MARIAINKCHDCTRRRAVRRLFSFALPIDAANDVADDAATPEGLLFYRQQLERPMTAIAALPGSPKEPLILRTFEGLSQAETALALGLSAKAVETSVYQIGRAHV